MAACRFVGGGRVEGSEKLRKAKNNNNRIQCAPCDLVVVAFECLDSIVIVIMNMSLSSSYQVLILGTMQKTHAMKINVRSYSICTMKPCFFFHYYIIKKINIY